MMMMMSCKKIHYDDDVFYLFLQKQKIGAKLHIKMHFFPEHACHSPGGVSLYIHIMILNQIIYALVEQAKG